MSSHGSILFIGFAKQYAWLGSCPKPCHRHDTSPKLQDNIHRSENQIISRMRFFFYTYSSTRIKCRFSKGFARLGMVRRPISLNIQYHAINIVNVLLIFKDRSIIIQAAGQEAIFNTRCRFKDFGFYDPANPIPFYSPKIRSALSQDLKVCQECYIASIAPTPLAKSFCRDYTLPQDSEQLIECVFSRPCNEPAWKAAIDQGHEGPLVHWMKEVDAQKENLSKCPQEANSISQFPIGERIIFHTLRGRGGKHQD